MALGNALRGGYTVHPPEAGPVSTNMDDKSTTLDAKKNQYESMFINGDAISLAPHCNGMSKLAKVPLNPAVRT
jgi:hypothetical protein